MMPRKDKDQYPYITPHLKVVTHGFDIPSYFKDGTTERQSGTSQACAIVSGILTLFAEKENGGFPMKRQ
ncbi:MAG: hypothetical protein IPG32_16805 [Saprospirales bacterium]|nr:hypothetical protein [Saprospirales bacterium]